MTDTAAGDYKVCQIVKAGIPRSTMLAGQPGKRVKLGSGAVDHHVGIAAAFCEGNETKALRIAEKVVSAKAAFRSNVASTESLHNLSVGVNLQREEDYKFSSTFDDSSRSSGQLKVFSSDEVFGSDEDRGEEGDEYSDGSSYPGREGGFNCGLTDQELDSWLVEDVDAETDRFNEQLKSGVIEESEDILQTFEVGYVFYMMCELYDWL